MGVEAVSEWVARAADDLKAVAGIAAVYLSGSVCVGAFNPISSDLDLVVITADPIDRVGLRRVAASLERQGVPPADGGLDLELFTVADSRTPSVPLRWHGGIRWHGDAAHAEVHSSHGYGDVDWAPSLELTRLHAIAVVGPEPGQLIGPVPEELLLAASRNELAEWSSYQPHWSLSGGVLTACRAWWFWAEGGLGSKIAAAEWALSRADPSELTIIQRALDLQSRSSSNAFTPGEAISFIDAIAQRISGPVGE